MPSSEPAKLSTDTQFFQDIINDINKGEIKIPQFQRKFVWKAQQALELLDSVFNRYPIGSVLLWKTRDKLSTERNIGNFTLPQACELSPTNYVLDGQQRITVIYSCLNSDENGEGFQAAYDLTQECFVEFDSSKRSPCLFPLRKLFNTTSLLNFRQSILSDPDSAKMQEKLDSLVNSFCNYKVPVVTLKDLTLDEVCPIFERINSSGTRLSTYDLMVAATWTERFDLNEKVDGILNSLDRKGYGDTSKNTVLKAISAIENDSIQEKSLKTLRDLSSDKIDILVARTQSSLERAVDTLSTEFGIYSWDFVSYEAMLLIVAYLFKDTKELDQNQASRLKNWFWRASLGERYKVGGENFATRDMPIVVNYVLDGEGDADQFGKIPNPKDWIHSNFRSNVARSRSFILLLASKNPKNISNGMKIDVQDALSGYAKKEFHHFYPQAFLRRNGVKNSNVLANIIMLTANSNRSISDSSPCDYVPQILDNLGEQAESVFESNLLPSPIKHDYSKLNYTQFLSLRADLLSAYANSLVQ